MSIGKNSSIGWTDHTFNPWWGCTKKSPGCAHCYAEVLSKRVGYEVWGPQAPRHIFGAEHWREPLKWNRDAIKKEGATTVFCGSMCDVFEDRSDVRAVHPKLWKLIEDTPELTWLLLTKNPENVERMIPEEWLTDGFPINTWLGVSVENQNYIHRIALIADLTVNRFVSVEPMLGPVDLIGWHWAINWVICGGESGKKARKMELQWARSLKELCEWKHIPFFMKQLGSEQAYLWTGDRKGEKLANFPEDLRVREFPRF